MKLKIKKNKNLQTGRGTHLYSQGLLRGHGLAHTYFSYFNIKMILSGYIPVFSRDPIPHGVLQKISLQYLLVDINTRR